MITAKIPTWRADDRGAKAPPASSVRVLVVGGLTRLEARYRADASSEGVAVDAVTGDSASLADQVEAADAVVLVVNHVSHPAAAKVKRIARLRAKPVAMVTSSSVSRVRDAASALGRSARLASARLA